MSEIPPELRRLWTSRDRKPVSADSHEEMPVLLTFKDGEDPDTPPLSEPVAPPESPMPDQKPETILSEAEPIRNVKLFPTYKIAPSPISLATFDVKSKRK